MQAGRNRSSRGDFPSAQTAGWTKGLNSLGPDLADSCYGHSRVSDDAVQLTVDLPGMRVANQVSLTGPQIPAGREHGNCGGIAAHADVFLPNDAIQAGWIDRQHLFNGDPILPGANGSRFVMVHVGTSH